MSLAPGTRIGTFEVIALLGEGGMGQVYRARDLKLDRDVALKILPDAFAGDPDRLARFDREAKTLASLSHPHIAAIYGIEARALIMELVPGEDLSALIARGPIPIAEALPMARQLADALEAAHDSGIVHRDLKPANIKVRADGTVKVLDFGLAKALNPASSGAATNADNSPTITAPPTERGVILGTAAYMSPEQARGRPIDKRTDIWSFGVVLYEMLAGTRAFVGDGLPDVLAAVVKREIDWTRLPAATPSRVRDLLERCLEPDPKLRLRDIGEAKLTIAAVERGNATDAPLVTGASTSRSRRRERLAWGSLAVALLTGAAFGLSKWIGGAPSPRADHATRLSIMPPPATVMNPDSSNTALSPDGRMMAFVVGAGVSSENQLWVRDLDAAAARRIESGDGVSMPFWSADSRQIGFFASRKLKTVAATGGPARVICDAPFGRGAAWSSANVIVFAPDANGPLYRVSAESGTPVPVTTLDAKRNESGHRFPVFLPDGDHFLFAALPGTDGVADLFAASLKDPGLKALVGSMETAPAYAEPGWLLFTRQGVLVAQPFDVSTLKVTGSFVTLGDEPRAAPGTAAYDAGRRVTASTNGSLAFIPDPAINTTLQWMDASGKATGAVGVPAGRYETASVSPDNTRAILVRRDEGAARSLWVIDLTRASAVPIGSTVPGTPGPVWSADSQRVAFVEIRDGQRVLSEKTVADSSASRPIATLAGNGACPRSWANGDILINRIDPGTKWNVYRLPQAGAAEPAPLLTSPAIEVGGLISPDGKWMAYLSDEAGRLDVYVQPYPAGGAKEKVSTGGVWTAWWNRDGREILYLRRDQTLWRVTVDLSTTRPSRVGTPEQIGAFPAALIAMDFAARTQRFLALVPERAGVDAVTIVQAWTAGVAGGK